jgi:colanic acid/amylovoran biosynthesis glycosyltransferase
MGLVTLLPTIAHIRDIYLGLSETFIYQYLSHLGVYRPIVLTRCPKNTELFPFDAIYSAAHGRESQRIWRMWHEFWRLLTTQVGIIPSAYDLGRTYFERITRQEKVELLHAHFGSEGVRSLPLKRKLDIPLVTTFYGFDMSILPRRPLWRKHYRRLFAKGDLFLVEGNHMKQELVQLGCPPGKIRLLHIAVDMSKLSYNERRLGQGEKTVLLFCGRFTEKKGLIYALEAVHKVCRDLPNIEFRIIGGGRQEKQIRQFITQNELESFVVLLGYQPYSVFAQELQKAHIFIQPSVTARSGDTEGGAPTTLIEAQATGLPVLASHHADIPEVVLDGQSGYLVAERDVDALAEKLHYLVTHPKVWAEMGRAGREHTEQNYNIETEIHKLESVYDMLLS